MSVEPPDEPERNRYAAATESWLGELDDAVPGDFSDVVRRAATLQPERISAQDVEDAAALPTDESELRARLHFGTLDDFLDDATAFVTSQRVDTPPPLRAVGTRSDEETRGSSGAGSGRWLRIALLGVGLAAAVVLVPRTMRWGTGSQTTDASFSAAQDRLRESARDAAEQAVTRRPQPAPTENERSVANVEEGATLHELAPHDPPQEPTGIPDAAPRTTARRDREARLRALDDQARAAWKRGELATARNKLEALARLGGRRDLVDIAYGDLFNLARQTDDEAGLRRYWRRYVKRFPRGRFIDDARAGLCRAARGETQRECWQAYLVDRPRGTYRDDARRALEAFRSAAP